MNLGEEVYGFITGKPSALFKTIYLKGEQEIFFFLFYGSFPKWLQQLEPGEAKARNQLFPGLALGWQGSRHPGHLSLLPQVYCWGGNLEVEQLRLLGPVWDVRVAGHSLTQHTSTPASKECK